MFVQQLLQANLKTSKFHIISPLRDESTDYQQIQFFLSTRKAFQIHDVITFQNRLNDIGFIFWLVSSDSWYLTYLRSGSWITNNRHSASFIPADAECPCAWHKLYIFVEKIWNTFLYVIFCMKCMNNVCITSMCVPASCCGTHYINRDPFY